MKKEKSNSVDMMHTGMNPHQPGPMLTHDMLGAAIDVLTRENEAMRTRIDALERVVAKTVSTVADYSEKELTDKIKMHDRITALEKRDTCPREDVKYVPNPQNIGTTIADVIRADMEAGAGDVDTFAVWVARYSDGIVGVFMSEAKARSGGKTYYGSWLATTKLTSSATNTNRCLPVAGNVYFVFFEGDYVKLVTRLTDTTPDPVPPESPKVCNESAEAMNVLCTDINTFAVWVAKGDTEYYHAFQHATQASDSMRRVHGKWLAKFVDVCTDDADAFISPHVGNIYVLYGTGKCVKLITRLTDTTPPHDPTKPENTPTCDGTKHENVDTCDGTKAETCCRVGEQIYVALTDDGVCEVQTEHATNAGTYMHQINDENQEQCWNLDTGRHAYFNCRMSDGTLAQLLVDRVVHKNETAEACNRKDMTACSDIIGKGKQMVSTSATPKQVNHDDMFRDAIAAFHAFNEAVTHAVGMWMHMHHDFPAGGDVLPENTKHENGESILSKRDHEDMRRAIVDATENMRPLISEATDNEPHALMHNVIHDPDNTDSQHVWRVGDTLMSNQNEIALVTRIDGRLIDGDMIWSKDGALAGSWGREEINPLHTNATRDNVQAGKRAVVVTSGELVNLLSGIDLHGNVRAFPDMGVDSDWYMESAASLHILPDTPPMPTDPETRTLDNTEADSQHVWRVGDLALCTANRSPNQAIIKVTRGLFYENIKGDTLWANFNGSDGEWGADRCQPLRTNATHENVKAGKRAVTLGIGSVVTVISGIVNHWVHVAYENEEKKTWIHVTGLCILPDPPTVDLETRTLENPEAIPYDVHTKTDDSESCYTATCWAVGDLALCEMKRACNDQQLTDVVQVARIGLDFKTLWGNVLWSNNSDSNTVSWDACKCTPLRTNANRENVKTGRRAVVLHDWWVQGLIAGVESINASDVVTLRVEDGFAVVEMHNLYILPEHENTKS